MNCKIVFSDIDGTFIRKDHSLSDKHAAAVKKLLERKIPFILVSARMPEAIYPITNSFGVKIPVISYSGALVLTRDENVLFSKTIDENSAIEVLDSIKKSWGDRVSLNYYAGRKWYVENFDSRVRRESNTTTVIPKVTRFDSLPSAGILPHKILVMSEPPLGEEMEKILGDKFPQLNVVRSSDHLLEIMARGVTKATGIESMLKHYGISKDDAIAFGDNFNDREMLKYVGFSVAMGNSPDEIKSLANEVTDSNNDDGIYNFLIRKGIISE